MYFCAVLAAAKLTGRMRVIIGIGRLDSVGRFQPCGHTDYEAVVHQAPDGSWTVTVDNAVVRYNYFPSCTVTHAGMIIHDQWLVDPLPEGRVMYCGDVACLSAIRTLSEVT